MQTFFNILILLCFIKLFIIGEINIKINNKNKNEQTDENGNSITHEKRNDDK